MRYSGTWLTPEDEAILEHLQEHGPATPGELAAAGVIDYSEAYLAGRCSKLAGRGQLVVYSQDRYRINGRGEDYLDGELEPAELGRGDG
jgi:hypothetical protein